MVASTAIHKSILIAVGASKLVTIVAMVHRDVNLAAAVASCAHHEPLVSAASAHLDSYLSSEMTSLLSKNTRIYTYLRAQVINHVHIHAPTTCFKTQTPREADSCCAYQPGKAQRAPGAVAAVKRYT